MKFLDMVKRKSHVPNVQINNHRRIFNNQLIKRMKKLNKIDHIALQTTCLSSTIRWYEEKFLCEVIFRDKNWALIRFENINIALVRPCDHPPHISFVVNNINKYGIPGVHRDGVQFIYEKDNAGNVIELIDRPSVN